MLVIHFRVKMKRKFNDNGFYSSMMEKHKEKLILDKKKERHELKKRIILIELDLEGMGERDFNYQE